MSNVYNFNNYNLSKDEIIRYADNGTIDAIPSDIFMKIIKEYEDEIDEVKGEVSGKSYDDGYDEGWVSAVEDMQRHLNGM